MLHQLRNHGKIAVSDPDPLSKKIRPHLAEKPAVSGKERRPKMSIGRSMSHNMLEGSFDYRGWTSISAYKCQHLS